MTLLSYLSAQPNFLSPQSVPRLQSPDPTPTTALSKPHHHHHRSFLPSFSVFLFCPFPLCPFIWFNCQCRAYFRKEPPLQTEGTEGPWWCRDEGCSPVVWAHPLGSVPPVGSSHLPPALGFLMCAWGCFLPCSLHSISAVSSPALFPASEPSQSLLLRSLLLLSLLQARPCPLLLKILSPISSSALSP